MTKDRPRNRPGNGGKRGNFGDGGRSGKPGGDPGREGPRDFTRSSRDGFRTQRQTRPPQREPDVAETGGDEAPWTGHRPEREQRSDRPQSARPDRPQRGGHGHGHGPGRRHERKIAAFEEDGQVWVWGLHAASAALGNKQRRISRMLVTRNAATRAGLDPDKLPAFAELAEAKEIDRVLPTDAVHQGIAVRARPLDAENIEAFVIRPEQSLAILDQVTDPHNVGAIYRSAAAFGVGGVVLQTRNAPALGGALAKAATGAIESVAEIRTVNISRAIEALTSAGWNVVGLDGSAEATIDEAFAGPRPLAVVLGAEGAGLRPGVAASCSMLARIPMGEGMESLNVSNAAAIAFYEASRRNGAKPPPKQPARRAPQPVADDSQDD